jgi:Fur family ferric uptake transcriptional regulator
MDKCKPQPLLTEKKIKVTKQRIAVLDLIISKDSSFSANDLFDDLNGSIDLVTIYRSLQLFCEEKILREVMNKDDRQYFEISCVHNPAHPHFYCNLCKKIFCIKSQKNSFPALNKLKIDESFTIHETVLQYSGVCPSCKSKCK